jgi:hypothetical protein
MLRILMAGAGVFIAASASAQSVTSWTATSGIEQFASTDIVRGKPPVDASPVAWQGSGPGSAWRGRARQVRACTGSNSCWQTRTISATARSSVNSAPILETAPFTSRAATSITATCSRDMRRRGCARQSACASPARGSR